VGKVMEIGGWHSDWGSQYELYPGYSGKWLRVILKEDGLWYPGEIDGDNGFVTLSDKTFTTPQEAIKELTRVVIAELEWEIGIMTDCLPS
jgi:hypothetical protein